jgi:hypothetical protein
MQLQSIIGVSSHQVKAMVRGQQNCRSIQPITANTGRDGSIQSAQKNSRPKGRLQIN